MSDDANFRRERIERLFFELRYEIERGFMQREIAEDMGFRFIVPMSSVIPDGVVVCEFRTRPMLRENAFGIDPDAGPRLRVVK